MANAIEKNSIQARVRESVLLAHFAAAGEVLVPTTISNRHVHLSQEAVDALFGPGHALAVRNALFQPGQYACEETITLRGPKGGIPRVRVLGPARKSTQAEVSITDCYALGVAPSVRLSGDTAGTPGIILEGPRGSLALDSGVIVAARHVHASEAEAKAFGWRDGDRVSLSCAGPRPTTLHGFIVRVSPDFELEAHVDTDEANAACLHNDILLAARLEGSL